MIILGSNCVQNPKDEFLATKIGVDSRTRPLPLLSKLWPLTLYVIVGEMNTSFHAALPISCSFLSQVTQWKVRYKIKS